MTLDSEEDTLDDSDNDLPPPLEVSKPETQSVGKETSLLEQMMKESAIQEATHHHQRDEKEPVEPPEPKQKKKSSGMKKGFLLSSKKKKGKPKVHDQALLKAKPKETSNGYDLPKLVDKVESDSRMMEALKNPEFTKTLNILQQEPHRAKEIFEKHPEFVPMMQGFGQLFGTQQSKEEEGEEEKKSKKQQQKPHVTKEEQERVDKVLQDKRIQKVLTDPEMQRVLQDCSVPGRLHFYMQHPTIGPKLQMLVSSGLLNVQQ